MLKSPAPWLPLPKGEGRGEGEEAEPLPAQFAFLTVTEKAVGSVLIPMFAYSR